jgi:hypothetical protein
LGGGFLVINRIWYKKLSMKKGEKMNALFLLVVLPVALIALDLAALRWGFDSSDGVNSPAWERRQKWYGFR